MIVRREVAADHAAVDAITRAAFERDVEADLTAALREDADASIDALSLVAEGAGGPVVGHVICTRAHAGGAPLLGLGPIAVTPGLQRGGVGSALMHAVIGAADALGEQGIVLLGDPTYYSRFGFVPAAEHGISPPVESWAPYFQLRTLHAWDGTIAGAFAYAAPFDGVE